MWVGVGVWWWWGVLCSSLWVVVSLLVLRVCNGFVTIGYETYRLVLRCRIVVWVGTRSNVVK